MAAGHDRAEQLAVGPVVFWLVRDRYLTGSLGVLRFGIRHVDWEHWLPSRGLLDRHVQRGQLRWTGGGHPHQHREPAVE